MPEIHPQGRLKARRKAFALTNFALLERAGNPVISFGKQLGRDEIYAAVLAAVVTAIAYWILDFAFEGEPETMVLVMALPIVGPVLEKPGLLAHYVGEGVSNWRKEGGSFWSQIGKSLFDGRAWRTLRADLLFHDPAYAVLLSVGIALLAPQSGIAVGFLSVLSFFGAVMIAAAMEVGLVELAYRRQTDRLKHQGFDGEEYYETRYLIVADDDRHAPEAVLDRIIERFNLGNRSALFQKDSYFVRNNLGNYNGRAAKLRLRSIQDETTGKVQARMLQVVYTRPDEYARNAASLFRCFPIRKAKFIRHLGNDIDEKKVLEAFKVRGDGGDVAFSRIVARDPDGLFVSMDVMSRDDKAHSTYWIEVKVRDDLELLGKANEFIAMNFPVRGTTKGKFDIVGGLEEFKKAS